MNESTTLSMLTDSAIPADRQERLAEILDRYLSELELGVPPHVDDLIAEHPDLADELRLYVDSLHLLHGVTTGLHPSVPQRSAAMEATSKRLGDYEIVRELGRGGMGIVYEARQLSLNRQVALKVLPFAAVLDDKQLSRFRTEAQAAAQLHHPHIVPVFAVGQERGVHFYAMQYIEGQSLDRACDELRRRAASESQQATSPAPRRASAGERSESADTQPPSALSTIASSRSRDYCRTVARLGVQAAEALQHAHEYGIVHRDVKPSNLLLDHDGKLWVTDFGLARMQAGSGVTVSGDLVGTLRYMSPEQAAGNNALVDPRSDVYALGATLYELLTLKYAHDGENREQLLRQIEQEEPKSPHALNEAIPADLETIVLTAMAKSREDRYDSAQEMADDLSRFLAGKPTLARRPTLLERGGKWLRRHQRVVLAATLCLAVLTVMSTLGMFLIAKEKARTDAARVRAEDNYHAADRNLQRAEEHFEQARQVVDRFGSQLADQLADLPGSERLRGALLRDTLEYYREFIAYASNDPELQEDLARTCFKAARVAEQLGARSEAHELYEQALRGFQEIAETQESTERLVAYQALCNNNIGLLLASQNDTSAALAAYRRAIELETGLVQQQPERAEFARSLAETYGNLGLLQQQTGRIDDARRSLTRAVQMLEELAVREPLEASHQHDLAITCNNLSYVLRQDDWQSAEASCRRAITILEKLTAAEADTPTYVYDLALCYNNLGAIQGHRNSWSQAAASYRQAIDRLEQLARQAPAVVRYQRDLAVSLNNLGQAHSQQQDWHKAEQTLERGSEILSKLVEDYPDQLQFRSSLAGLLNNQALALERAGQDEQALPLYSTAIEHQRFAVERAPQTIEYRTFLSKHYVNYGRALRATGRPGEAAQAAIEHRKLWPEDGDHLFQIGLEIVAAARELGGEDATTDVNLRKHYEAEAIATLRQALRAGYQPSGDLAGLDELDSLHNHAQFVELVREVALRREDPLLSLGERP